MKKYQVILFLTIFCLLSLFVLACAKGRLLQQKGPDAEIFETRCGWFSNPTPSNISLFDRDGEWVIGVQGGYQVTSDWNWPDFSPEQWVNTNLDYGYGCVCMQMKVNSKTHEVVAIKHARAQSLAKCNDDRALEKWKPMFK